MASSRFMNHFRRTMAAQSPNSATAANTESAVIQPIIYCTPRAMPGWSRGLDYGHYELGD